MSQYKHAILFVAVLWVAAWGCRAQDSLCTARESTQIPHGLTPWNGDTLQSDTAKTDVHLLLGTGIYGGMGQWHSYTAAATRLSYRASDRLTLTAGFALTTDRSEDRYDLLRTEPRSLAPRRHTTTGAVAMDVAAEYQLNDNLWMAARLFYLGGSYNSLWYPGERPMELNVYGGSLELHYRTKHNHALSVYFDFVRDETGALTPWMYHTPMLFERSGFLLW